MKRGRRSRLVLGLLLLSSLTLITLDLRSDSALNGFREISSGVVAPLQRATANVVRPVGGFFAAIGSLGSNREEIERLEAENVELRSRLLKIRDSEGRVTQLDRLFNAAGTAGYRIVAAQVIAVGPASSLASTVTIDVGRRDGITEDMTVMTGEGLVGRVVSARRLVSTVVLVSDPSFNIGVRLAGSDILGIVSGQGSDVLRLQLLDPRAELRNGDQLVARGSAGGKPFVPGVPVGTVSLVERTPGALTRTALVSPSARLSRLDIVGVVVAPPRRDPRDSLLPKPPTPTPVPTVTIYAPEPQDGATPAPTVTPTAPAR